MVYFDFDGTLTRHDSFVRFAIFSVGKWAFLRAFLYSTPYIFLWKLGVISSSYAKQKLFSNLYRGMEFSKFKDCCEAFTNMIQSDIRPEILKLMHNHKRKGQKIIIVSASIGEWIRPWAKANGIDDVIATEIDVDQNGIISGSFRTDNCTGEEKVRRIIQKYPLVKECETWGYGDSSGDDAMLSFVDHPFRV